MPDLRPFEERSADHLRLVIEASDIGVWELDLGSGRAVRNHVHDRIFGYSETLSEWTYDMFLDHIVEEDRARVDRLQQAAIADNREWSFECRIATATGEIRWIRASGRPLQDDAGKTVKLIGNVIDITDTKQNEARLQLITEELNHRVRNMLATIKSMVRFSAKKAADIPSFAEALEGRVRTLARSHQLLVAESDAAIRPSTILEAELSAFPGLGDRVKIAASNEPVLRDSAGQGLALVFHELLTNALKYGALSNDEGHVEVTIEGAENSVSIRWKEHGGPPLDGNKGEGFGTMLISRVFASQASTSLTPPSNPPPRPKVVIVRQDSPRVEQETGTAISHS